MNLSLVDPIAKAVLYEGFMLYPYRPSSVKNRQRWNFGVLFPQTYSDAAQGGTDAYCVQTECLVRGNVRALLEVKLRLLQLQLRGTRRTDDAPESPLRDAWQEAVEREVAVPAVPLETALLGLVRQMFELPPQTMVESDLNSGGEIVRRQEAIRGDIEITVQRIRVDLLKVRIAVRNTTPLKDPEADRDEALLQSMVSTHIIMGVEGGEFISLLEPPTELQDLAAQCQNIGAWPVLVGEEGQRDTMLASPIILYDYPQIAPESAGDLFDGTEIDEILSLRIITLTDEEKREIRQSDERARQILERTEAMPAEQFMKLHGAVRGLRPLKETP
jgi:hypothetical protein